MTETPPPKNPSTMTRKIVFFSLLGFVVVATGGITMRIIEERSLKNHTEQQAISIVSITNATSVPATEEVTLPGVVQAWHEAVLYARTSGYLKKWGVDIGAHVKQDDIMAEIDAPDLDAQLHQAEADLTAIEANSKLAQVTAQRWQELLKTNSVSKQDVDTKQAAADSATAAVASARANLDHLKEQVSFKKVVAPFEGTVTARNTDLGALISASGGTGQDLFHIADTSKLRIYVQIPETFANMVTSDLKVDLIFPEQPNQPVTAAVARMADALDTTNKSLNVEFDIDNSENIFKAGGYVTAHLHLPAQHETVMIPVNTLLFRDGTEVAILGNDNHVHIKKVTIGRDYGKTVEITGGLTTADQMVINPGDSLQEGQQVRLAPKHQN